eukprot:scaffold7116_cov139-Skeletonema_dohrnii-CCMP3373.AAC.2
MNSIKQRKHNTPSPVADDDLADAPVSTAPRRTRSQDYNNHNAASSKWKNRALLAMGITFAFFVAKDLKESFFRAPTSSSSQQQQQQLNRSSNNNNRLRAQPQPPLIHDAKVDVQQSNQLRPFPYLKLQAMPITKATTQQQIQQRRQQIPPNYGRTPLTGSFTLGAEYHLSQNTAGDDENDESAVGGIIYFPYADLSTMLPEDVTSSSFNLFGFVSTQQDVDKVFPSVLVGNNINNNIQALSKKQAILTRCGFKPSPSSPGRSTAPNQDRSFIANFFFNSQPNTARDGTSAGEDIQGPTALLMGIYDGHGGQGHVVSHFVALELPRIFTRKLIQSTNPQTTVGSSQYDEYITQIFKDAYLEVDSMEPAKGSAGCTASSLFYPGEGTKAYVANVGDSTTMIVKYSKSTKQSTIVHQNRKHKPHLLDEKVRINAAGGEVMIPPSLRMSNDGNNNNNNNNAMIQESSRLLVPDPNGSPFGGMALAMSRAIGDSDAKVVGLISEPDVDVWDLNNYHKQQQSSPEQIEDSAWFAVVASDGMYDVIPPEEVANLLGQSLYSDENVVSPLEAWMISVWV